MLRLGPGPSVGLKAKIFSLGLGLAVPGLGFALGLGSCGVVNITDGF